MDSTLLLHDGDTFEDRNLIRQMARRSEAENGVNKAEAMAMEIAAFKPCSVRTDYLKGTEDLFDWMFTELRAQKEEGDEELIAPLIVLCVDNDATRKMVYDALDEVPKLNVAVIDLANELDTGHAMMWVRFEGQEPFLHPRKKYPQLEKPADRPPGGGCVEQQEHHPQLITANMMAATLGLQMVMDLLDFGEDGSALAEEVKFKLREFSTASIGEVLAKAEPADE